MTSETAHTPETTRALFDWGSTASLLALREAFIEEEPDTPVMTVREIVAIIDRIGSDMGHANPPIRLLAYLQCEDTKAVTEMLTTMRWERLAATIQVLERALGMAWGAWDEGWTGLGWRGGKQRTDRG